MLSAFTDGLLAAAVGRGTGKAGVTIHLSVDFLHMAREGDWVIGEARMTRATKDVAFVEGCAPGPRRATSCAHLASSNCMDAARGYVCGKAKTPISQARRRPRGVAQPGSASALGAEGRGFESLRPDHAGGN